MRQVASAAEAQINSVMTPELRVSLDLESAKWHVFGDDGRPHEEDARSGYEDNVQHVAVRISEAQGRALRVVMLDDKDFAGMNGRARAAMYERLRELHTDGKLDQVFIASWLDGLPSWCHVIRTSPSLGAAVAEVPAPAPPPTPAPAPVVVVPVSTFLEL